MTKEGLEYISDFIKIMSGEESIVRIMKQNYLVKIGRSNFDKIILPDNTDGFFCEFSGIDIIEAYEPFLSTLKSIVNKYDMDIESLMEKAEIYRLHRGIFKSYIQTGAAKRQESLLVSERDFEKSKFIEGLIALILEVAEQHPIFILINNAKKICASSLDILEKLQEKTSLNLNVLVITSEEGDADSYVSEKYNEFMQKNTLLGIVMDGVLEEKESVKKKEKSLVFKNTLEELVQIENMLNTLAIEQAEYYIELIYQNVEVDKAYVSEDYRMKMLTLYASASIYSENYSYALIACDKFRQYRVNDKYKWQEYHYFYYKALADMYTGNEDEAIEASRNCIEVAKRIGDDFLIMQSMLVENMSYLSGWKDIWISSNTDIGVTDTVIELCKKYHYMNHLAHVLVYSYHNDCEKFDNPDDIERRIPEVFTGIELAKDLGNDAFLIEAYRKCIMMASCGGYFETTSYFYLKSVEIVKKDNNKFEEANLYNGLGYTSCTADRFEAANTYYNKALKIFYDNNSDDYILETLYNMGLNAILAADYTHALEFLIAVNNIIRILKKDSLRVCNISKVFGLIAIAAFKQGNYYTAQMYCDKAEQFLGDIIYRSIEEFETYLWSDDMFLYMHVKALMAEYAGRYEEALDYYQKSEVFMQKSSGNKFFSYVYHAEDMAKLLRKLGKNDEALVLLKSAREFFDNAGNPIRLEMFEDYINKGKWTPPVMVMDLQNVTMAQIMDCIKLKRIENEAVSTRNHLRFFGTFQELVNNNEYKSVGHITEKLITTFEVNFNLDNILYISCEDGNGKIDFSDLDYEITEENVKELVEYFEANTAGFALSKLSNNYNDYQTILKIFEKSKIFSIIGAPIYRFDKLHSIFISFVNIQESWNAPVGREVLDDDERNIYMIVFRQIIDAIEKFKLNEEIKQQAITDELTGLYNRNGYYKILDRYVEDVRKSGKGNDTTIMYMDLDHFKYYNDTFGHHLGDELLKEFAGIFVKASENYGDVIRFGGDEFIILLNSAEDETIDRVVSSVYKQIKDEDGFSAFVSRYNDAQIVIPQDYRATCSIGIGVGKGLSSIEEYSELEKHADSALYYGKKNGRGRAVRYEEIA